MGSFQSNSNNTFYLQNNDENKDEKCSMNFEVKNLKIFETIKTVTHISCDYKCLCRIAFCRKIGKFIVTDCEDSTLKIFDYDGNFIKTINPSLILRCPWAICVNNKSNEIFIADGKLGKILVFSAEFKYLREFGRRKVDLVECLTIDETLDDSDNDKPTLYAADYRNNLVTIWNSRNGVFKSKFNFQSPADIAVDKFKIFITSENNFQFLPNTRKLNSLKGENSIFVLDKTNFKVLNKIRFNNWLSPNCIYFDYKNNHLATIAFDIDEEMNVSKTRYLYVIDKDTFTCLYKIDLNIDKTSDMCIVEKDDQISALFSRGPFKPGICLIKF
jgi:hypothetical protein